MTDITSSCTFYADAGQVKRILVILPATAASGDTIDLNSDVANGYGAKIKTITNTLLQDDLGADKTATWVPGTGIITLGTITTGIHNLIVWGLG
jgi:hypothetical protein